MEEVLGINDGINEAVTDGGEPAPEEAQ